MYQSTDKLVSNEQGDQKDSYQSIEGGTPTQESKVPDAPVTFLSQVKRAKEESTGCCSFCMAFFGLLLGSIVWTIVVIVIITVPIVMIVIGAEYFNECPVQKMIPISMVVAGCVALLGNVLNFVERYRQFRETGMPKRHTIVGWINVFINLFLMAWFIATCYWVYSVSGSVQFDPSKDYYCNSHLYGFVFWLLNFTFIFFGSMIIISGLMMCLAVMFW